MVRDRIQARVDRLQRTGMTSRFVRRRLDPDAPSGLVLTAGVLLGAIGLLGFSLLASHVLLPDVVSSVDEAVNAFLASVRTDGLTAFFSAMTFTGNTGSMTVLVIVAVVIALRLRRKAAAVYIAATVAGGSLLVSLMKWLVDRPRPPLDLASFPPPDSASFPSGHTMASFLFAATVIVGLVPAISKMWARVTVTVGLVGWALTVAFSRVYLGVHWPSDVLASWFLGVAWFALTTTLYAGHLERKANERRRGA